MFRGGGKVGKISGVRRNGYENGNSDRPEINRFP